MLKRFHLPTIRRLSPELALRAEAEGMSYRDFPKILTTNKPLAALGRVLHDADLAQAILHCLLERGTHYVLRGRSDLAVNFESSWRNGGWTL